MLHFKLPIFNLVVCLTGCLLLLQSVAKGAQSPEKDIGDYVAATIEEACPIPELLGPRWWTGEKFLVDDVNRTLDLGYHNGLPPEITEFVGEIVETIKPDKLRAIGLLKFMSDPVDGYYQINLRLLVYDSRKANERLWPKYVEGLPEGVKRVDGLGDAALTSRHGETWIREGSLLIQCWVQRGPKEFADYLASAYLNYVREQAGLPPSGVSPLPELPPKTDRQPVVDPGEVLKGNLAQLRLELEGLGQDEIKTILLCEDLDKPPQAYSKMRYGFHPEFPHAPTLEDRIREWKKEGIVAKAEYSYDFVPNEDGDPGGRFSANIYVYADRAAALARRKVLARSRGMVTSAVPNTEWGEIGLIYTDSDGLESSGYYFNGTMIIQIHRSTGPLDRYEDVKTATFKLVDEAVAKATGND